MVCILDRVWIKRTQHHSPGITTGLVCLLSLIICKCINLLIVTLLHYSDLVLQFNDPSLGEH